MSRARDRALAKAAELDALPPGELREDLGAFLGAETCSFADALRAVMDAAGNEVMSDPDKIEDARTAPRGWLQAASEQAEDDEADRWCDEADRVLALYEAPVAHELREAA